MGEAGLFAGISLNGAVLTPDKDANQSLYNRTIDAKDLLMQGDAAIPEPAKKFVDAVTATQEAKRNLRPHVSLNPAKPCDQRPHLPFYNHGVCCPSTTTPRDMGLQSSSRTGLARSR